MWNWKAFCNTNLLGTLLVTSSLVSALHLRLSATFLLPICSPVGPWSWGALHVWWRLRWGRPSHPARPALRCHTSSDSMRHLSLVGPWLTRVFHLWPTLRSRPRVVSAPSQRALRCFTWGVWPGGRPLHTYLGVFPKAVNRPLYARPYARPFKDQKKSIKD